MANNLKYCYLVCDTKTDLPLTVCDNAFQIMEYLELSRTTVWRMIKKGVIVKGCYVERVLL